MKATKASLLISLRNFPVVLSVVVQNLLHTGRNGFSCICWESNIFYHLYVDTVILLGYDHSNQNVVIKKIQAFIGMIDHMSLADIMRLHNNNQIVKL